MTKLQDRRDEALRDALFAKAAWLAARDVLGHLGDEMSRAAAVRDSWEYAPTAAWWNEEGHKLYKPEASEKRCVHESA